MLMESQPDDTGKTDLTSYSRVMHEHTQRQISGIPNLGDRVQEYKNVGNSDTNAENSHHKSSSSSPDHDRGDDGSQVQEGGHS